MIFYMKQTGNWGFFEIYALPIKARDWFFNRLSNYYEELYGKKDDSNNRN